MRGLWGREGGSTLQHKLTLAHKGGDWRGYIQLIRYMNNPLGVITLDFRTPHSGIISTDY